MCSWSLDMLSAPQETLELQTKQKKPVAVTSLAFPPNDINNFVIGSEEGDCYQGTNRDHGSIPVTTEFFLISCDSNQIPKWFGTHFNLEVPL